MSVVSPEQCERLYGGSAKVCVCRLPEGGWLECPPEARGILGPAEPPLPRQPPAPQLASIAVVETLSASPAAVRFSSPPRIVTGEMCREPGCGGFLVRTGSCLTCQSCGANEGCG